MEAYQSDSAWHMKLYNPEVSAGTANIIKIHSKPRSLPTHFQRLSECGRDWKQIVFAEATTGVVRFTSSRENPSGHFATNVWFLQSEEAQRVLELSNNCAAYKHRLKILKGTTAMVGRMTSSDVIQFFFPDPDSFVIDDSAATNG